MNVVQPVLGMKGIIWLALWGVVLIFILGLFIANRPSARSRAGDARYDEEDWSAFDEDALSGRIQNEMGRIRDYWEQERRMLQGTLRQRRRRVILLLLVKELLQKGVLLLLMGVGLAANQLVLYATRLWVWLWRNGPHDE